MFINLVDGDLTLKQKKFFPKWEVMQVAQYYKENQYYVSLLLNEENIRSNVEKIYVFHENKNNYIDKFYKDNRSVIYDTGLIGGEYIPIPRQFIKCKSNFSIYEKYLNKLPYELAKKYSKYYNTSLFVRFNNEKLLDNIDSDCFKPRIDTKRIFIYDDNCAENIDVINFCATNYHKNYKIGFVKRQLITNLDTLCILDEKINLLKKKCSFSYKQKFFEKNFEKIIAFSNVLCYNIYIEMEKHGNTEEDILINFIFDVFKYIDNIVKYNICIEFPRLDKYNSFLSGFRHWINNKYCIKISCLQYLLNSNNTLALSEIQSLLTNKGVTKALNLVY